METYAVVVIGDPELVRWPLTGAGRPTLAAVEEIARLYVAAKRAGWPVRLADISPDLAGLLELVGLIDVCRQPEIPE